MRIKHSPEAVSLIGRLMADAISVLENSCLKKDRIRLVLSYATFRKIFDPEGIEIDIRYPSMMVIGELAGYPFMISDEDGIFIERSKK